MNNFGKNLALWIIIGVLLVLLFNLFQSSASRNAPNTEDYSQFIAEVDAGQVSNVTIQGKTLTYQLTDKRSTFTTHAPDQDPELVGRLINKHVNFKVVPTDENMPTLLGYLLNWL